MTRTTVSVDGENLRARVDHAKTLLERGDRVALLAYLTGASEDDVRRVGGFPAIPVGVDDQVAAVRAALDYGGDYMPDSRVHFDGFAALDSLADLARDAVSLREALRDLAEHGCRHDLNPTRRMYQSDEATELDYWWLGYCNLLLSSVPETTRDQVTE